MRWFMDLSYPVMLSGAEAERAFELIKSNWGGVMRRYERGLDALGVPEAYVEVVPVNSAEPGDAVHP